jgi:hypothetical protein
MDDSIHGRFHLFTGSFLVHSIDESLSKLDVAANTRTRLSITAFCRCCFVSCPGCGSGDGAVGSVVSVAGYARCPAEITGTSGACVNFAR